MYLTFDVETAGLHGEAFAVGFVITKDNGDFVGEGTFCCPFVKTQMDPYDQYLQETVDWLGENVISVAPPVNCVNPADLRRQFYVMAQAAKIVAIEAGEKLYFVTDVCFPCETGFLHSLKQDAGYSELRIYPLLDVASMLFAKGFDPTTTYTRAEDEYPVHNPLNDARQSSRIFHELRKGEFKG